MSTPFQGAVGTLNDSVIDTFGIPMTIDGQPVTAKFNRPLEPMRSADGKRPLPLIDIKTADLASINTSSGIAVVIEDEEYIIVSREPGYRGRTIINLRRSV